MRRVVFADTLCRAKEPLRVFDPLVGRIRPIVADRLDLHFLRVAVLLAVQTVLSRDKRGVDRLAGLGAGRIRGHARDRRFYGLIVAIVVPASVLSRGEDSADLGVAVRPDEAGESPIVPDGGDILHGSGLGGEGFVAEAGRVGGLALVFTGRLLRNLAGGIDRFGLDVSAVAQASPRSGHAAVVFRPNVAGLAPVMADERGSRRLAVEALDRLKVGIYDLDETKREGILTFAPLNRRSVGQRGQIIAADDRNAFQCVVIPDKAADRGIVDLGKAVGVRVRLIRKALRRRDDHVEGGDVAV